MNFKIYRIRESYIIVLLLCVKQTSPTLENYLQMNNSRCVEWRQKMICNAEQEIKVTIRKLHFDTSIRFMHSLLRVECMSLFAGSG
jgi:hypothetical protein